MSWVPDPLHRPLSKACSMPGTVPWLPSRQGGRSSKKTWKMVVINVYEFYARSILLSFITGLTMGLFFDKIDVCVMYLETLRSFLWRYV